MAKKSAKAKPLAISSEKIEQLTREGGREGIAEDEKTAAWWKKRKAELSKE